MFERRDEKLTPMSVFVRRMAASMSMAGLLIAVALAIDIIGYHWLGRFAWVDSLLEASMILGGMGIVLAPVTHRMLHKFHIDEEGLE